MKQKKNEIKELEDSIKDLDFNPNLAFDSQELKQLQASTLSSIIDDLKNAIELLESAQKEEESKTVVASTPAKDVKERLIFNTNFEYLLNGMWNHASNMNKLFRDFNSKATSKRMNGGKANTLTELAETRIKNIHSVIPAISAIKLTTPSGDVYEAVIYKNNKVIVAKHTKDNKKEN